MRKMMILVSIMAAKGMMYRTICTNICVSPTVVLQFQSDDANYVLDPPRNGPPLKAHHYRSDRKCEDCYHFLNEKKCALYPYIKNVDNAKNKGNLKLFDYDIDYLSCTEVRCDDTKCGKQGKRFEAI